MNFRFAKYSETISSEKHNFCTTCSHCECAWKIPFRLVSFLPSKVLNKNVSRHFWILHFDEHTDLVQYRVCSRLLRVKAQNTRTHTHIAHIAALEETHNEFIHRRALEMMSACARTRRAVYIRRHWAPTMLKVKGLFVIRTLYFCAHRWKSNFRYTLGRSEEDRSAFGC